MIIFLRRIPADTRKHEIINYIEPFLKGGVLQKSGRIEYVRILTFKDNKTEDMLYHGLVSIDSDAVAKRVIKKLNRKAFNGKHIAVREYFQRSWHNDPRINMHEWNEEMVNKRQGSRRQPRLEAISDISDEFKSSGRIHDPMSFSSKGDRLIS